MRNFVGAKKLVWIKEIIELWEVKLHAKAEWNIYTFFWRNGLIRNQSWRHLNIKSLRAQLN